MIAHRQRRRRAIMLVMVLASAASACATPAPSVPPAASASPAPTVAPTASSAVASPTPATTDCPVASASGRLPSDRLTGLEIRSIADADHVIFTFDLPTEPLPQGSSEGRMELAEPPFVAGGSGEPLDVEGEHVVFVRFEGMTLYDQAGEGVYDGPDTVRTAGPGLRSVVLAEAFEGVSGWYIGWDGPGCVELASDGRSVSVVVRNGPG